MFIFLERKKFNITVQYFFESVAITILENKLDLIEVKIE